jgi:predicted nucleotidyltransferase
MFAQIFKPKKFVSDQFKEKIFKEVLARIAEANPLRAIVFGSYSSNTATEDSDIDVLVICRNGQDIKSVRNSIYKDLKGMIASVPVDFIFVTEADFKLRKQMGGVCMIANNEGITLYEASL